MSDIHVAHCNSPVSAPFSVSSAPSSPSTTPLTIGLWNARGLRESTIDDVLRYCESFSLLFITETWLRHAAHLPTSWQQFHLPGVSVAGNFRGSRGVSCLVNPKCPLPVFQVPIPGNEHVLGIQLGRHLRVICLYIPPDQAEFRSSDVAAILDTLPLTQDTIICGDLNARMGEFTGDSDSNSRGNLVRDWCNDHSLSLLNRHLAYGIPTFHDRRHGRFVSSIVDYYITNISTLHTSSSSSISIYSDLSLGSDHKLMALSFKYTAPVDFPDVPVAASPCVRRLWNLSRLKESPVRKLYVTKFDELSSSLLESLESMVSSPPTECPDIDSLNDELNTAIYSALNQSIGSRMPRPSHWKKFWTPDLQAAADTRERYYQRYRHCHSAMDKIYWWNKHQDAHNKFKQDLRKAKRSSWRAFCNSLATQDISKALSKVKQLKSRQQRQSGYVHPDGPAAGASAMREHLASVYSGASLPAERPPTLSLSGVNLPFGVSGSGLVSSGASGDSGDSGVTGGSLVLDELVSCLSTNSIAEMIKKLPRRKAPGSDSLRAEMLVPLQQSLSKLLSCLFTICYQWSYTPSLWRHAQVVPIHKKGDPSQPSNFRPISLTSIMRKLFEMCLFPVVQSASPTIDVAQGGFRSQRSALDQALCLHDLMKEYYRVHHHYPVVAFLDIKAAYDTVDRRVVWNAMLSAAAPLGLVSLLSNLFDNVTVSVLLSNVVSAPFSPCTGVLQGSVLSPHLYSVYINSLAPLLRSVARMSTTRVLSVSPSGPLVSAWSAPSAEIAPSPTAINLLLYADDVALFGSALEVQRMLSLAESHSQLLGYRWSPPKCALLNSPSPTSSTYVPLTLYGELLPAVDEFIYLGVPFRRTGIYSSGMVLKSKPGAMASMSQLNAIGVNRSGFPFLLSSRLYASFVRPKLEYGLAISKLLVKDYNALEKVQDSCLRMIFGGHRAASTMVFRHLTNLPSMRFRADVLVTKYCIRAQYLPDDCLLSLLSSTLSNPSLPRLKDLRMVQDMPEPLFSNGSQAALQKWFCNYRQKLFNEFVSKTDKVLIRACPPVVRVDPVMYLPASRTDRSRLIRWRMGWLPGKPKPCPCGFDHTSRRHLQQNCYKVPAILWSRLPLPPSDSVANVIDYALNQLPLTSKSCPDWWSDLCTLLWHFDQLCNPDGDYSTDPTPGLVWSSPEQQEPL